MHAASAVPRINRQIGAVLFDLDDTLHDDTLAYQNAAEQVAHDVAAEHGIDALALKAAYIAQAEGFWSRLDAGTLKQKLAPVRVGMWNAALREVGLDVPGLGERSAQNYVRYRANHLKLFPGASDLLQRLRAAGMKLGLVTNGFSETHRDKIAVLQIGDLFDAVFIADEVGMLKPDPLLFAHAVQKLGQTPSSSAMVGDRYERDIRGALEAGLYTIWMNVRNETLPGNAPKPHATVSTISEVGHILLS